MSRTKIKIVSKLNSNSLSFFYMSDNEKWCLISPYSELHKYENTSIIENTEEIINAIDKQYNTEKRGVDVVFKGTDSEYQIIRQCIEQKFTNKNVECQRDSDKKTIAVIAGKISSGKTTFIEEICNYKKEKVNKTSYDNYIRYNSISSSDEWYEINGIDLGKENMILAQNVFDVLTENNITHFIYCISNTKIEKIEESFISYVKDNYPNIKVLLLLTNCLNIEDENIFAEKLRNQFNDVKVIPILARSRNLRVGIIESFGIEDVCQYLFDER